MSKRDLYFDEKLGVPVVPGRLHTLETLAGQVGRICKRQGVTAYRIAKATGMGVTINAASRLLRGYTGQSRAEQAAVKEPFRPGAVQLGTFLQVVQALGYDVELVAREPTKSGAE